MSYPHVIRLGGPWEFEPLACSVVRPDGSVGEVSADLPPGRISLPADWGQAVGEDFCGRVRFRRRFGRPSGMEPHERVWLVCEGVDACGTLWCNEQLLGPVRGYALPAAFDVTDLLDARNELWLDVELPAEPPSSSVTPNSRLRTPHSPPRPGREKLPGGPIGQVRLEIRPFYFLDRLCLVLNEEEPRLMLAGVLAGPPSPDRFEIVAMGSEGELLYTPLAVGGPFEFPLRAEGLPDWTSGIRSQPGTVAVRLLRGGTRLWQAQFQTARRSLAACTAASVVEMIDEAALAACDAEGRAVIQSMPPSWAAEVCPRLAHHPSIVAWTAPAGSLEEWTPPGKGWGRPWVARERVGPAPSCGLTR
jgi:hypothetical protein